MDSERKQGKVGDPKASYVESLRLLLVGFLSSFFLAALVFRGPHIFQLSLLLMFGNHIG